MQVQAVGVNAQRNSTTQARNGVPLMRRILKYALPPAGFASITAPGNPQWLAVGWQNTQLVAWAEVDEALAPKDHQFEVAMTGYHVPSDVRDEHAHAVYLGTAQLIEANGAPYVVHVYRWERRS